MVPTIDLNADLGEGFGKSRSAEDQELLDLVSSANIACGFHAGDAVTMSDTVFAAKQRGVSIGAHPSYPDLPGFGRRELGLPPAQISFHVTAQLRALRDVCNAAGARMSYVKPHGALYNRAARDAAAAEAIVAAVLSVDPDLALLGLPGSAIAAAAANKGISFAGEAFIDRAYASDSTLVPRSESGALIEDVDEAVERALVLARDHAVRAITGERLSVEAQSLCVHGDNPNAATLLRAVRNRLESSGFSIARFRT
ncbi:MAG TPA: 5-oxoprolinase subunit PxpA [Gemmatimonadaceae bacterium]|nr:5-oxoprolinase subunit PxpA [Gemmatimonadaceae bacterium]